MKSMVLAALVAAVAASGDSSSSSSSHTAKGYKASYGVLGLFKTKKCSHKPALTFKLRPGYCTPFPGQKNAYVQLECAYQSHKDDRSNSGSYSVGGYAYEDLSSSSHDGSSWGEWQDASDALNWDSSTGSGAATDSSSSSTTPEDTSSSSSSKKPAPKKHVVVKKKAVPHFAHTTALRVCRDHGCKKCVRIVVSKAKKCTALPAQKYWNAPVHGLRALHNDDYQQNQNQTQWPQQPPQWDNNQWNHWNQWPQWPTTWPQWQWHPQQPCQEYQQWFQCYVNNHGKNVRFHSFIAKCPAYTPKH